MGKGWIKLHRAIEEHPRFKDAKWLQVWIKCLVLATHNPFKTVFNGKVVELQPGQFITSRKSLARETHMHESSIERILRTLEIEQQIEQQGGVASRLISITKWEEFQNGEQDDELPPNSERTPSEQRPNTNKNGKKVKNERIELKPELQIPPPLESVKAYCLERKSPVDPDHWFAYYEANGWRVGKVKMSNWKASIRYWEKNSHGKNGGAGQRGAFGTAQSTTGGPGGHRAAKAASEFPEALSL